ncbi:MAG: ADP-ribosylglycohydrolase family protein [Armatimonadetes bacterium]|nr:ADP-ribosylglycohydrolase family protein [Armatimonadota bacterium]
MAENPLEARFIGAMLGTFIGDALGMPVEGWPPERIAGAYGSLEDLRGASIWLRLYGAVYGAIHDSGRVSGELPLGCGTYTDDTQMMIGVAESLAACGGFDGTDMARRFVANFDPCRGYGPGAMRAIAKLRQGIPWNRAGGQLFGRRGSFGNGSAMRVAPVGLFYGDDPPALRQAAELSASITHTHPLGLEGAAVQAYAVALAVRQLSGEAFLEEMRAFLRPDSEPFSRKLAAMEGLLRQRSSAREVVAVLGNGTESQESVPAAIYAFLSHPESFREAVVYAVSLGGDTDTIGAMAGAIAGAYHGADALPAGWLDMLENGAKGRDYIRNLARQLYERRAFASGPISDGL